MTVLQLAHLRAGLCPGEVRWDWPPRESRRKIVNWRFARIERPAPAPREREEATA